MSNLITYKLVSDYQDKLKPSIKTACDFWNRFIIPQESLVIRLETYTNNQSTNIALARKPYRYQGTLYGWIQFNTRYLAQFEKHKISSTLIHEIAHCLGFGWGNWLNLFDRETGELYQSTIDRIPELTGMLVETDYGAGTTLCHWDEATFGKELMTGIKDNAEHISPASIAVMQLLGHEVIEHLSNNRLMTDILNELNGSVFARHNDIANLDLDHEEESDIWEELDFGA